MAQRIELPDIPASDRTPVVNMLLKVIAQQQQIIAKQTHEIETLKSEVNRLKKRKGKPKLRASQMNKGDTNNNDKGKGKRAGSSKRRKNSEMTIHRTKRIELENVPEGALFKGYEPYVVQELVLQVEVTRYELARWELPDGSTVRAELPMGLQGYHFGPLLRTYVLHNHHHGMTQRGLYQQLQDWSVDISKGQLTRLLVEDKEVFHQEKAALLTTGLEISSHINVDDTGARHAGKNGYCTHIGNELFAWFESTASKSRINFLALLRNQQRCYRLTPEALSYMEKQRLPSKPLQLLTSSVARILTDKTQWNAHLARLGISKKRHIRIATEGALIGSILYHGFNMDLAIVSDDAGQFNIFQHALCWIHEERKLNALIPGDNQQATQLEKARDIFWSIYRQLKAYKTGANLLMARDIRLRFRQLCRQKTGYIGLDLVLKRLGKKEDELLLVLDRPELPLHNNLSENDIRDYVTKRKVHGGTRSDDGRRARDTFTSLKKTCRKLKINFWDYLIDRISKTSTIPPLPDIMRQYALDSG